jgi:outer membrane biosynthesis protein TonB
MPFAILHINRIDRQKRIYATALILSLLIHLLFFLFLKLDYFLTGPAKTVDETPEEVTILFPENKSESKPKQIVENINENEQTPDNSDLLSDRNSRASNPEISDITANQPRSEGNIPYANLTNPNLSSSPSEFLPQKKFSKDALRKSQAAEGEENFFKLQEENITRSSQSAQVDQQTTNNIYDQKKFSSDQLGSLTLSTYAWEWAPYINALKRKLQSVWFAPAAYYRLGLIHGYTEIRFTISREGRLTDYEVLNHVGHESLQQSSVNAVTSVFPFKELPADFPEDKLTITARLIYPNLREGSY